MGHTYSGTFDKETVKTILEKQEMKQENKLETTQATKNIFQRIAAVQKEIGYLKKDKNVSTGGQGSYRALTHDKVVGEIRGLLVKNGIATIPNIVEHSFTRNALANDKSNYFTSLQMEVEFVNVDDRQDRFSAGGIGYGMDTQDKGAGKAMSYCVKYIILKTFMIESGDEEEDRLPENYVQPGATKQPGIKDDVYRFDFGAHTGKTILEIGINKAKSYYDFLLNEKKKDPDAPQMKALYNAIILEDKIEVQKFPTSSDINF